MSEPPAPPASARQSPKQKAAVEKGVNLVAALEEMCKEQEKVIMEIRSVGGEKVSISQSLAKALKSKLESEAALEAEQKAHEATKKKLADFDKVSSELAAAKKDLTEAQAESDEIDAEHEKLKQSQSVEYQDLKCKKDILREDHEKLRMEYTKCNSSLDSARSATDQYTKESTKLQAKLDHATGTLNMTKKKVAEIQNERAECDKMQKQVEMAKVDHVIASRSYSALFSGHEKTKAILDSSKLRLNATQEKVAVLDKEYAQTKADLDAVTSARKDKVSELEKLKAELQMRIEELGELEAAYDHVSILCGRFQQVAGLSAEPILHH